MKNYTNLYCWTFFIDHELFYFYFLDCSHCSKQPFYNPYIDEDLLYNCYVCISYYHGTFMWLMIFIRLLSFWFIRWLLFCWNFLVFFIITKFKCFRNFCYLQPILQKHFCRNYLFCHSTVRFYFLFLLFSM